MATQPANLETHTTSLNLRRYLPFLDWLLHYDTKNLSGDVIAGIIVAVMLVPQGVAYALLAGLPPEAGLYASIAPLIIYGLLGTSRSLAVGPTAVVSLLVITGIGSLNPANTTEYVEMALILALQVGIIQLLMGLLRVGFLVNFLSHPVLVGFTSAAAIVIGFSQVKHLIGVDIPRTEHFYETLVEIGQHLGQTNITTLTLSGISVLILLLFKLRLGAMLLRWGVSASVAQVLTKTGPLVVVVIGTMLVFGGSLYQTNDVAVVGDVPAGLPALGMPSLDINLWQQLFPIALTISLVGFMESISVAKSLASKKRQKIDANQELVALGAANFGAAFTGGYPVTGGLSRTLVNYNAGANTGLASIITAGLILLTVIFLTPLFYYLPNAVLAGIIVVAVSGLFDFKAFKHAWAYDHTDGLSMFITFLAVLVVGIEMGILVGVAASLVLYLYRTSRPHTAIIGRIDDTEHFRNVQRHSVTTYPQLTLIRVDESLYFPNATYLEEEILGLVADQPDLTDLVLVCSAVNYIDISALEVLEKLIHELHDAGVRFHMAEVKGPVMDRLQQIGFINELGQDRVFISTHAAVCQLT